MTPDEIDTYSNEGVVCPYCGHLHKDDIWVYETGEYNCENCGEDFDLEVGIRYSFETYKREENT